MPPHSRGINGRTSHNGILNLKPAVARPERPERSRSALPLRQLSRSCYLMNSDMVFGTHSGKSVDFIGYWQRHVAG
jgi:hypothetical protein